MISWFYHLIPLVKHLFSLMLPFHSIGKYILIGLLVVSSVTKANDN